MFLVFVIYSSCAQYRTAYNTLCMYCMYCNPLGTLGVQTARTNNIPPPQPRRAALICHHFNS
ncbi:hypothetical protein VFPPC_15557 [Pochonia chlamydosporia 170]|uniref:Uncharacterized protein n=1 Tax=Pochonia chlamydosporia 170 TaxID=1380566 RepID=A0A179FXA8_METCM|nr:hypothetical protein VFPPC_15557 [Pochonia chlamydosporia 170]OAQ70262.1 hypothetical protein VFPPC_15557 [Pochonia chlamydosporia 170]